VRSAGGKRSFSKAPPFWNSGSANKKRVPAAAVAGTEADSFGDSGFVPLTDTPFFFIQAATADMF
jgi:hypothetical protein